MQLSYCMPGLPAIWQAGLGQGMMGYWNVGFSKEFTDFLTSLSSVILAISHCPIFPEPIIPSLQYYNIPIVPARHRSRSGEAGGSKVS